MKSKMKNTQTSLFDVVVLAASAGGHIAVTTILHNLPANFPVPILVMLHLGTESTGTPEVLGRQLPFTVSWLQPDATLAPGKVLVCPPKSFVDLLPDGTFVISPSEGGALVDKPMDRLLTSIARSFGERAIGVILTGMGSDGALGARQLHLAGGTVVVQSESSAEYPDMPRAAIKAGAADLVVPLQDIGQVIGELVAGTPRPQARSEIEAVRHVFGEKGKMAARAREIDWSDHPLGPVHGWPVRLRELVRLVIDKPIPAQLLWGERQFMFFNEAAIPTLGDPWTGMYGNSYLEAFPDRREDIQLHMGVLSGEPIQVREKYFTYQRNGRLQDSWFDGVYTPIHASDGTVVGIYISWFERTWEVLAARRLKTLNQMAASQIAANRREALELALNTLQKDADISLAVAYLIDAQTTQAMLVTAFGVQEGGPFAPRQIPIQSTSTAWPFSQVVNEGKPVIVDDLAVRFRDQLSIEGQATPGSVVIYPLRDEAEGRVIGTLVLGTNARLVLDEHYHEFLTLLAETIESKVVEAHASQRESERLERFAELDHAKTEFFANVSHEFRTPLALLLAPLEDLLRHRDELPGTLVEEVEVAANNSRRLLRLVNSLLDFSQIDSRRQQANFESTDLCALTTDIASAFRSSIEAAGLRFRVECDPNLPPVPVDRDMWEKIVSNLLSNAFKFTFEGEIAVTLHALSLHAELVVKDTGIGIPAEEMPNLFKRFHRVRGARARTVEGSGIGLSIVDDLVKRLGGQLRARSTEHVGTEFTIWIPYKSVRMRSERSVSAELPGRHEFAEDLAKEALRWLVDAQVTPETPVGVMEDLLGPLPFDGNQAQGRILVVDDNADVRNYLRRLLRPRWNVELAANGDTALKTAIQIHPDLILADVMMPGLDGFALIQRIRENPQLEHTPVVLLTARAGEEAAIQGLLAGASDYIAKPFSPRELVARIQAAIERARADRALRESEAKFRTVFESIDEGFLIHEVIWNESGQAVDYRLLEINPAYTRMTGLPRDLVGKLGSEFMANVERYWLDIFGRVARTGVPERAEWYNQPTSRWYNVQVTRVAGHDSRIAIVFDDVTARKQAELELTRTNQLLQATFDNSLLIIQLFKAVRDERGEIVDFEWLMTNKQWNDRWGAMAGKRLLTQNPAVIQTGLFDEFKRVTETGVVLTQEHYYNYEQFDGWFLQTVAKVEDGFLLSTLDITERKLAEEALRESEGKYRNLFDSIDEGFCIIEVLFDKNRKPLDYRFIEINSAFERQTGIVNGKGKRMREIEPRHEAYWFEIYGHIALSGEAVRFIRYAEHLGGRWYDVYAFRVGEPQEHRVGILFNDISERKRSEMNLAFLADISQDLAQLTKVDDTTAALSRKIGEFFKVSRVNFAVINEAADEAVIIHEWHVEGLKDTGGERVYRLGTFINEEFYRSARAGEMLVVCDTRTDPRTTDAAYAEIDTRSFVTAPFVRNGEWQFLISIADSEPRDWQEYEIELLREITNRIWWRLERARAEEALHKSEARLAVEARTMRDLYDSSRRIFAAPNLQAALEEILQSIISVLGADFGNIQLYNSGRGVLEIASQRGFRQEFLDAFQTVTPDDNTTCGRSIRTGERVIVEDVELDADYEPYRQIAAEAGYRAVQSTPLLDREGKLLGVISTYHCSPFRASEADLLKLDLYARQAIDFIERARAEEELRVSEEKYRTLFEEMDQGFCILQVIFDDKGQATDLHYLEINPIFERESGLKNAVGKRIKEMAPDIEPSWIEFYGQVARTGKPAHVEDYAQAWDQWFKVDAYPIGDPDQHLVAVLLSDVTERKRAEAELHAAKESVSQVLESISEVFYAVDASWHLTYLNHRAEQVWHRSRQELLGTVLWDMFPNYWETQGYRDHVKAMQEHTPRHAELFSPNLKTWVEVHIYPSSDGGLAVYFQDITERKRAEADLQARNDELEHINKVNLDLEGMMIQLKKQVNALRERLGEPPDYLLDYEKDQDGGNI